MTKPHKSHSDGVAPTPGKAPAEIGGGELARLVKLWKGERSTRAAAADLGLPTRTLEGIEQGRGFRYPRLLIRAMSVKDEVG